MTLELLKTSLRDCNQIRTELNLPKLEMYKSMDPPGIELIQWGNDPERATRRTFFKTRQGAIDWLNGQFEAFSFYAQIATVTESPEDLP